MNDRDWKTVTATVTCDCEKCHGLTARLPASIAQKTSAHEAVVLASMPYGAAVGATIIREGN